MIYLLSLIRNDVNRSLLRRLHSTLKTLANVLVVLVLATPSAWAQEDNSAASKPPPGQVSDSAAQDEASSADSEEAVQREVREVTLEFDQETWFTDVVATATVPLPESVEQPEEFPFDDDVSVIDISIAAKGRGGEAHEAVVRFLPRHAGLCTFPSLEFISESIAYRTPSTQFIVSEPQRSEEMSFELTPASQSVFVGEPLRIDVSWSSREQTTRFRSLRCFPPFFNDDNVEVVIPRCTAEEDNQMGMPFGGRRIIVERQPPKEQPSQFGDVRFPLFVRFREPGRFELPAVRLEIALRNGNGGAFAPYAAYYNNGLFEPLSSLSSYERVYAESTPLTIEVKPLPAANRSERFSNLFTPCEIEVSIPKRELEVGQVVEVDLRIRSDAPHGMLELQPLTLQRSLRGRFHVSPEFGRTWYPDGTGFRARVRPLTTDVTAFPSLQIPVFDSERGEYRDLQTTAIPLKVNPYEGNQFFDVRRLITEPTLTEQPDGIWHNARPTIMTDFMNRLAGVLAEYMFVWLALGVAVYAVALPWVRERRRRAIDPRYRRQALAYQRLKSIPEGTQEKWFAFRSFLATGFSVPEEAWTHGNARQRLAELDLSDDEISLIEQLHNESDRLDFSEQKPGFAIPSLNHLADRLFRKFRQMPAMLTIALALVSSTAQASQWEEAENLFDQALESTPGLPETNALYTQAALKFEDAAETESRSGASWFNAGNAWFQSGELGRAIACYRQSQIYLPFDQDVRENLRAARALTVDVLEGGSSFRLRSLPLRWICAAMVLAWFALLATLLLHERYRNLFTKAGGIVAAVVVVATAGLAVNAYQYSGSEGVVIVSEVYGRKGPSYTYNTAFNESLHDGLEFHVRSRREDWLEIELADGRRCWVPQAETRLIFNRRL
ncbi:Tetratricopeptide TPR_2 repeat protein [Rhodopirellula sallentina SM41]|uniref:Tetratricopeptide TPR_2 repeat protein n=1 Tax=Rhodopirellula sallentina SM41 TaxID=1263870 RepID=M5UHI4_9BACT|nr:Tetratricopeptide TPR_2 repeat protein [Rhodopirellula sallentina SM41]